MRIAIPSWQGRVSPVFDVAADLTLVDLDVDGGRQVLSMHDWPGHERAQRIQDLEVGVLICGAISRQLEAGLQAAGIEVLPHICGDVEEVLAAYSCGDLSRECFHMPGCCRRRRQRCRGGRRV